MPRNLIVCMDGTGNEIGDKETNILRIYKGLQKSKPDVQLAHYVPGVGTLDSLTLRGKLKQKLQSVFGLAMGLGLEDDVLDAYRFLCRNYVHNDDKELADKIVIFGYSRGAYAARVLAGFIYNFGLVPERQLHLIPQVFRAYRQISDDKTESTGNYDEDVKKQHDAELYKMMRAYVDALDVIPVPIRFLGVFDTVSSMIRIRGPKRTLHNLLKYGSLIELGTHASVDRNPSVQTIRHILAIDERRSLFRGQFWEETAHRPTRFNSNISDKQGVKQVWFAGSHGAVAGQAKEAEAGIGKITLLWLLQEAEDDKLGLKFKRGYIDRCLRGAKEDATNFEGAPFSKPDPLAPLLPSMGGAWLIPEIIPKSFRRRDTRRIPWLLFWYFPFAERRRIPEDHEVHPSVFERREKLGYNPSNLEARTPKS